jgi:hypothetical protein
MKKTKKIITMASFLMIFICPSIGLSLNLSDLYSQNLHSPFISVYSINQGNHMVTFDWKIMNIPPNMQPVDVYLFLKPTNGTQIYYMVLDLMKLLMGGSPFDCLSVTKNETPFLSNLDLFKYATNGDLIIVNFPVIDLSIIPNISSGYYIVYMALVDPQTQDVITYDKDMINIDNNQMLPPPPEPQLPYYKECDCDNDGFLSVQEMAACKECDLDGDGKLSAQEAAMCNVCENNNPEPQPPYYKECDCDNDGFLSVQEMAACKECDLDGDGKLDDIERAQCKICEQKRL